MVSLLSLLAQEEDSAFGAGLMIGLVRQATDTGSETFPYIMARALAKLEADVLRTGVGWEESAEIDAVIPMCL